MVIHALLTSTIESVLNELGCDIEVSWNVCCGHIDHWETHVPETFSALVAGVWIKINKKNCRLDGGAMEAMIEAN